MAKLKVPKELLVPPDAMQTPSQTTGGTPAGACACPTNFLSADSAGKFQLAQDLAKSWDLVASGTLEPIKVTEEEVAIAEVGGTHSSLFPLFLIFHSLSFMLYLYWFFVNCIAGFRSSDEGQVRVS